MDLTWVTSSYSATSGDCVQVARTPGTLAIRDSKDPDGPILRFTPAAWQQLVEHIKTGGRCTSVP